MNLIEDSLLKARKTLSEIRAILQCALKEYAEAKSASTKHNEDQEPIPQRVVAIVSYDEKTAEDKAKDSERQYRIQRQIRNATRTAVVAASIYAGIAAYQAYEMRSATKATQDAATAAQKASDIAAGQLELAERPWVDANIALDGPFRFNVNGAGILLKITLRNTGHSPAMSVTISPAALFGSKVAAAISYREQACRDATRITTTMPRMGLALSPNITFEQHYGVGISKEDIENGKASKEFPGSNFGDVILSPYVVVCVAYRPTFNQTSIYHTSYIFDLIRLDAKNQMRVDFKIGEDVDQKHLLLRLGVMGAINAD